MTDYPLFLDKERVLRYSNRSFRELEKRTGKPILKMMADLQSSDAKEQQEKMLNTFFSSQFITDFIWAGLRHENMSYEEVDELIPVRKLPELVQFAIKVITTEFGLESSAEEIAAAPVEEKKNITEIIGIGAEPS